MLIRGFILAIEIVTACAALSIQQVDGAPAHQQGHALAAPAIAYGAADPANLTVHLVFGNHLDIGFDNIAPLVGYDYNVINKYWHAFFPRAIWLDKWMQKLGHGDRYRYTTHSFLLSLFLDCPPGMQLQCPIPAEVAAVRQAIADGVITWHAHPHNAQYEFYDKSLLEFSFDLTHILDTDFGLPNKSTAILRDVPGITRTAIPVLVNKGVRALSVGVNPGSAPPGVPKCTPFIWRDPQSGEQLVAYWHPGGYGGLYKGLAMDSRSDCMQAPGLKHVLCTAWRSDNSGPPPTVLEVQRVYQHVRQQFPGANVTASSFDAFTDAIYAALPTLNLPVVTGEIGDTWIHGVQSDPLKTADFRAVSRARAHCIASPDCDHQTPAFYNFSRLLLKVPEHTWGLDVKTELHDFLNYTNAAFHLNLVPPVSLNYQRLLTSWERQAAWIDFALQALPTDHPVSQEFAADLTDRKRLASISEASLQAAGAESVELVPGQQLSFESKHWHIGITTDTGAISTLVRLHGGKAGAAAAPGVDWAAGRDASMLQLVYNVYTEQSYDVIWDHYAYRWPPEWWFPQDFGKFNSSSAWSKEVEALPTLEALWRHPNDDGSLQLHLRYSLPNYLGQLAGAPKALWLHLHLPSDSPQLRIAATWQDKTPTRLPEALWLRFRPGPAAGSNWQLYKLGGSVLPGEVMLNGSQSLHAVSDGGVSVDSAAVVGGRAKERLRIRTLDAALVSPGVATAFPNGFVPPDMQQGVSVNLVNNIWGTNYIMWCPWSDRDINMAFRLVLEADLLPAPEVQAS